ncbi:MAG: NUDIX domain-containing protein [Pseudomonadota bacterium]
MRQVVCPVALHPDGAPMRIAAFAHPQAGLQIVKGGLRTGERPEQGAARELFEESGLETRSAILLGVSDDIYAGERWHFALCRIKPPVRAQWQHLCADDGGHVFRFFWQDLATDPPAAFEARYRRALHWISNTLSA